MSFLRRPSRQVIVGSLLLLTAIASHAEAAQLQLTWTDNSQDEDGFKIERSTGTTGTFTQIGVTGPDITTYTDSGLANDTTYCYRVRAFNAAGDSDYSDAACGTTSRTFALAVVRIGAGNGTVSSSPPGIACGTSCSANYNSGTAVTLTATPATGSTFSGWSGGGCSGTGSCTVTMSAASTVTATFVSAPLTLNSITTDRPSPQGVDTSITFSANAVGGVTPYQYKWWLWNGSAWNVVQEWSSSSTFTWRPTTPNAAYEVIGWVRSAGNTADLFEDYRRLAFPIRPATLTVTADRVAPATVGTSITFTATGSGGTAPYQFKWWLWNGSAWNVIQDWSPSATFVWTPTVANPGYQVIAWVRSAGNVADLFESYTQLAFPISPPAPAKITGIMADKPSPQGPGVTITLTTSASGGAAPYQYKWWLWNGIAWNVVQDWSASAIFVWTPTGANPGYQLIAWVRSAGNTADLFESYTQLAYPISPPAPAKVIGITTNVPSPQGAGSMITFTASVSGGTTPYQFKWWLWNGSAWNVVQDWSASPAFTWRPTTPNAAYQVIGWVRSAGNTADLFEDYRLLAFPIRPATLTVTADRIAPVMVGTPIIFTAAGSGGTAPYQFKWWLWNGSAWNVVQDWSASTTFVWSPTVANPSYQLIAWVRSAGDTADLFESYTQFPFPVSGP